MASSPQSWVNAQNRAFVGWVNAHLAKERTKIREISDFCDGTKFITLLEILEKRKLRQFKATNRTPRHRFDQLETLGLVIRHLQTLKQNLTGISGDAIAQGNEGAVLALLWRFILQYGITGEVTIEEERKFRGTPEQILLQWVNSKLPEGLRARNFEKSFKKGVIFAHLINHALKDEERIAGEDMQDLSPAECLDAVFDIAEKQLAIPRLIDYRDLLSKPDKHAVMTYVSLIRSSVHASEKSSSHVEKSMNLMQNNFNTLEGQLKERIDSLERTLEASNRSAKTAEQALSQEIQRRGEKEKEQRNKFTETSLERNNALQEVAKLHDIVNQMRSERENESKMLEQTKLLLANSEGRTQELLSSSVNSSVVESINNENQQLKQQLDLQMRKNEVEKKEMETVFQKINGQLRRSNMAGKEYRERVMEMESELMASHQTLQSQNNVITAKEMELEDQRYLVKEIKDQMSNQQVVYKLQIQEMGHLIDEMREREEQTVKHYKRKMEELQDSHSLEIAKMMQEQYNQQDMAAERLAREQQSNKSKPRMSSNLADNEQLKQWNPIGAKDWEKTIEEAKTKYGYCKMVTKWRFVTDGTDSHEVMLTHNTKQSSGKSKRVLVVDGEEKYNDKSDTQQFYLTLGIHTAQVVIRDSTEPENANGFEYELYVDKMPFEDLRREFYIEMQRTRVQQARAKN